MKKLIALILLGGTVYGQPVNYWQQEVAYEMDIQLNVKKHQVDGQQRLIYTNNSPDTLRQVFYHLYFNAFKPGSMMDERAKQIPDPDKRIGRRIENLKKKEQGYHKVLSLTQDSIALSFSVSETVLRVKLNKPIPPGGSSIFDMVFKSQVPMQIRRSGRDNAEGIDYTMTQWYPKMAEYDESGWHPDPYVAREFYGVYGTYKVNITLDEDYKVGGTGTLKNFDEHWIEVKDENKIKEYELKETEGKLRTWQFVAKDVHDFAWAADTDYRHQYMEGPNNIGLHFYFLDKYKETWEKLPNYTFHFFKFMNLTFGQYTYPQFSCIQGGDGGMEYPMCTMLKGTGKMDGLVGVMVHEAAHSWYYGMLGSNENQHPWMDEGFTTFAEGDAIAYMKGEAPAVEHMGSYRAYQFLEKSGDLEPLSTPADYFGKNRTYGISAYSRGDVFLYQLKYIVGEKAFYDGMRKYMEIWRYKHPDPWDFIKVMEDVSNIQLDWYLNFWLNTDKSIDYAVKEVKSAGRDKAVIVLENKGGMPMPQQVTVVTKSGDRLKYQIPLVSMFGHTESDKMTTLKPWPWTHREYELVTGLNRSNIAEIILDEFSETADTNPENNSYNLEEEE